MTIIDIIKSPIFAYRFRVFLMNGDKIDFGSRANKYEYIDTHDDEFRWNYYKYMPPKYKKKLIKLRPNKITFESVLLNGPSTNIIDNINYYNKFLQNKTI